MAKIDSNGNPLGGSRGLKRRGNYTADWGSATPSKLVEAITAASNADGALRFGYTRDGGAYSLGIYGDGKPYTVNIAPSDDIDIILEDVKDLFEGIADEKASKEKGKKQP